MIEHYGGRLIRCDADVSHRLHNTLSMPDDDSCKIIASCHLNNIDLIGKWSSNCIAAESHSDVAWWYPNSIVQLSCVTATMPTVSPTQIWLDANTEGSLHQLQQQHEPVIIIGSTHIDPTLLLPAILSHQHPSQCVASLSPFLTLLHFISFLLWSHLSLSREFLLSWSESETSNSLALSSYAGQSETWIDKLRADRTAQYTKVLLKYWTTFHWYFTMLSYVI